MGRSRKGRSASGQGHPPKTPPPCSHSDGSDVDVFRSSWARAGDLNTHPMSLSARWVPVVNEHELTGR